MKVTGKIEEIVKKMKSYEMEDEKKSRDLISIWFFKKWKKSWSIVRILIGRKYKKGKKESIWARGGEEKGI